MRKYRNRKQTTHTSQMILDLITHQVQPTGKNLCLFHNQPVNELIQYLSISIDDNDITDEELSKIMEQVIHKSVYTNHKFFMNQMFGKQQAIAIVGEVLAVLLNTSMYTYEVSPALTLIEKQCIKQLINKVWHTEEGDGVFTPGSSLANMMAMTLARNERFPKAITQGLFDLPRFSLFASDQVHYSFVKGVMFDGFGKDALVKVKSDQKGRIMLSYLQDAIDTEMQKGRIPLMVIGIAGTTVAGVYDDLEAIADIARQYNLWFHVDGAYGASLLFSKTEKSKLNGIELADSVSWSLHKMMGVPLSCAVLLTRANDILARNFSVDADYLFHGNEYDLGQKSLQCGRRADALKLWLAWKFEGDQGFEQRVNQLMKLAMRFARMIRASQQLQLLTLPESPIICFRYNDHALNNDQLNSLNQTIRTHIFNRGKILFNYVLHREKTYLRCVLSDPSMTDSDLRLIIDEVNEVGDKQSSALRNSIVGSPHPIGGY